MSSITFLTMRLTSGHVCTCPSVKNESSESIPFIKQCRPSKDPQAPSQKLFCLYESPTPLLLATDEQFAVLVPANFRQALSQSGAISVVMG